MSLLYEVKIVKKLISIINYCLSNLDELIVWMNKNEGFLMVSITFVYVIATIIICSYNEKSVSAANMQILQTQKQLQVSQMHQNQNIGIQLYETRKEVFKKFSDKKYNEISLDICILFNDEINKDFKNITSKFDELNTVNEYISTFENHLKEQDGIKVFNEYQRLEANDNLPDSNNITQEALYEFCDEYTFTEYSETEKCSITYDYRSLSNKAIILSKEIEEKRDALSLKFQKYIKNSIQ